MKPISGSRWWPKLLLHALLRMRDQRANIGAVAWPRFTMMFAWMCEICASPMRKPLSPH